MRRFARIGSIISEDSVGVSRFLIGAGYLTRRGYPEPLLNFKCYFSPASLTAIVSASMPNWRLGLWEV